MADSNIKKVVIKNQDLPFVSFDGTDLFYDIRYRVISEDRNRTSHWSPFNKIIMPPTTDADLPFTSSSRIHINTVGNDPTTIVTTWTYPPESQYNPDPDKAILEKIFSEVSVYDIFVRWNKNNAPDDTNWTDWEYQTTISSNSFNILKPATIDLPGNPAPKQIQIAVQIPLEIPVREDKVTLFLSNRNI